MVALHTIIYSLGYMFILTCIAVPFNTRRYMMTLCDEDWFDVSPERWTTQNLWKHMDPFAKESLQESRICLRP